MSPVEVFLEKAIWIQDPVSDKALLCAVVKLWLLPCIEID